MKLISILILSSFLPVWANNLSETIENSLKNSKGTLFVFARIGPSGDPLDKSGVEVKTKNPIKLGTKNIRLVFQ
ncbi:MAG: hypothetical protein ACPGJV_04655 [Bacteriovoracaceae bacterium]